MACTVCRCMSPFVCLTPSHLPPCNYPLLNFISPSFSHRVRPILSQKIFDYDLHFFGHFHKDLHLKCIRKTATAPRPVCPISISKQQNCASRPTSGTEWERKCGYSAKSQLVKHPFLAMVTKLN